MTKPPIHPAAETAAPWGFALRAAPSQAEDHCLSRRSPTGGAGGSDSIWQFSPSYLDVGLNPNHQYGYRVKARDGFANPTQYSSTQYAYSDIENPESVEFGEITIDSIQAKSGNALSGLDRGISGLKLQNITAGQVSDWKRNNDFWAISGEQIVRHGIQCDFALHIG